MWLILVVPCRSFQTVLEQFATNVEVVDATGTRKPLAIVAKAMLPHYRIERKFIRAITTLNIAHYRMQTYVYAHLILSNTSLCISTLLHVKKIIHRKSDFSGKGESHSVPFG